MTLFYSFHSLQTEHEIFSAWHSNETYQTQANKKYPTQIRYTWQTMKCLSGDLLAASWLSFGCSRVSLTTRHGLPLSFGSFHVLGVLCLRFHNCLGCSFGSCRSRGKSFSQESKDACCFLLTLFRWRRVLRIITFTICRSGSRSILHTVGRQLLQRSR